MSDCCPLGYLFQFGELFVLIGTCTSELNSKASFITFFISPYIKQIVNRYYFIVLLAYLSGRLVGELIVYVGICHGLSTISGHFSEAVRLILFMFQIHIYHY